jgi:GT2 family glycosyltransferase
MAMRRSDWEGIGGLDERYFLWYEDIDLGARVHRSGETVATCDAVAVRHSGGNSLAAVPRRRRQRIRIASAFRYARTHLGFRASLAVAATAPAAMLIGIGDDIAHALAGARRSERSAASEESAG